jgi:hypothetical protein
MGTRLQSLFGGTVAIALWSSSLCFAQVLPSNPAASESLSVSQAQTSYESLPLTFEVNQGQTASNVQFLARGSGYTVFLTSGQMTLALRSSALSSATTNVATGALKQKSAITSTNLAKSSPSQKTASSVIQINLVGANENPAMSGENPQPGKVNYFIGNDPKKWRTNVPTYKQVRYKNVYPGIDLVYYGNQSRVEHDFIISPGADPAQIQLDVTGTDRLSIDANGDLVLNKGNDEIRLQAPVLYQEAGGMRTPVTGQYSVENSTRVFFNVGLYDKTAPLVIDPVLAYSTYLGGSGSDQAAGIGVDAAGDTYITGCSASIDFPLASQNGPPPSVPNAFVAKIAPSGSTLIYADYIGGNSYDCSTALTLDSSNDVYITGSTYSTDFPTVRPYQSSNNSNSAAAFVTEISPNGSSLLYSSYLSGSTHTEANALGVDSSGNIYVSGWTNATDFPTVRAYQSVASPNQGNEYGQYGFLSEFAAGGASLVYSTYYAGSQNVAQGCGSCWPSPFTVITSMAVDASGNAYVAGITNTYDFPTTAGAYQVTNLTANNTSVGFIGKFNSSGSPLYSTYYGAGTTLPSYQGLYPGAIAFDSNGSAYVVGTTYYDVSAIPVTTPNLCDPSQTNCDSGFISKFDPTGATVLYSTYLSSNIDAEPESVRVDANGDAYVYSQSAGGPPGLLVNPIELYTSGEDAFIQEIDPTGGTLLFSTFVGGSADDFPGGLALDSSGNIYITGYTDSLDYPVTAAAEQNAYPGGSYDAFVAKISTNVAPAVAISPSSIQFPDTPVGSSSQASIALLRNMGSAPLTISNITVAGNFSETDNCTPGVASASNCTLSVTFTPTQMGSLSGFVTIVDNAAGSPHVISLAGNGLAPVADLSPSTLTFSGTEITQTSPAQTVTLTNGGNVALSISSIAVTGEYAQTNNCPASLGIGSNCQIQVTFAPTSDGTQNGTLSITDNAPGSPQSVTLVGVTADFSMPASGGSSTISPGAVATYQFSISPVGRTSSQTITLKCADLPPYSTCTINPSPVALGANPVPVSVAIKTTGNSAQLITPGAARSSLFAAWSLTSSLGLFGMFLFGAGLDRKRIGRCLLLLGVIAATLLCASCGAVAPAQKTGNSTPAGTYTIMVIGTSGSVQHSTSLSLIVE